MDASERASLRWSEETVSEIVIAKAADAVTVVPFTRHAEALSGADWIWWWSDSSAAYGMLVQAKRMSVRGDRWEFNFDYPGRTGRQRATLLGVAQHLGLLPVYALYLGASRYRGRTPCPEHQRGRCLSCVKRSVSLMPALLADRLLGDPLESVYDRSIALEDAMNASDAVAPLLGPLKQQMSPELTDFLTTTQTGVRAVTRKMIDKVLAIRLGQFQTVADPPMDLQQVDEDQSGPIFDRVPADRGHWNVPYFEHVLAPLRRALPSYVEPMTLLGPDLEGLMPGAFDGLGGLVLIRLDDQTETD